MNDRDLIGTYRLDAEEEAALLATGFNAIKPELRQQYATSALNRWQRALDALTAGLGRGAEWGPTAESLAAERARIDAHRELIPTF